MKKDHKRKKSGFLLNVVRNEYYEGVSERLGIVQVVLYLSLLAFVVLSLLSNTELITYRNLYYFVKDLNASAETVDVWNTDSVSYPTDDVQSFTLYRQGLAVAGNTSVNVFTATGRQTISQTLSYRNPVAVGRGKYLLVYDMGGREYSLYNSYTQIHAGKTDYPINGADVSDTGMYALITESAEYTSVVSLYSSNFALLNVYNKNGYVMDVAINPKGNTVAMLSTTASKGSFYTEMMVCRVQETVAQATVTVADSMALSCVFTGNDVLSILCTGGAYAYTSSGEILASYLFEGDTVAAASVTGDGIAVCLKKLGTSEKKHLLVFDRNGHVLYNGQHSDQVDAIARFDDTVYLQSAYGIAKLDAQNGTGLVIECITEQKRMLAVSDDEILLCSPQKAVYINFDS